MMQWLFRARHWLVFGLLLIICFFALQKLASYSMVRVVLESSHATTFKVYWTTEAFDGWAESNSAAMRISNRKNHYVLPIPIALEKIKQLRIDPSGHRGVETTIRALSLHHLYTKSVKFGGLKNNSFSGFTANEDASSSKLGKQLKVKASGNDPVFVMDMPALENQPQPWLLGLQSGLLALLFYGLLMRSSSLLVEQLRWVPAAMLVAGTAVMVMASVSNYNTHPDEFVHIANARYYLDHYVPPEVCADDSRDTYTVYGVSRLDKREIAYYIGGRYLQLLDVVPVREYMKLRYLNVALFFILVLLAFREVKARIIFLPLLLTPQAWYLFSYYNSDALSLFVVMITAYQVLVPKSMLRRLLLGERPPAYILWVLGISMVIAMQYWLKLNYVFYAIFLVMLGASWGLLNRRLPQMQAAMPLAIAFVLGTSTFLSWEVSRHANNDFALSEKAKICQEKLATRIYKPSTSLVETHGTFRLKAKGYTIEDVFFKLKWPERIFYTGLGTYGYTEYLNSYLHFEIVTAFILLLFLYAVVMISIKGDGFARMAVLSTVAAIGGVTLAAFWVNWNDDFQPQGRYLMVYLPLFGSLMAMYRHKLNMAVVSLLAGVPFLLAVLSFFAVALLEISKQ